MPGIRQFLQSKTGGIVAAILSVVVIVTAVVFVMSLFREGKLEDDTSRMYIDTRTGKSFRHTMEMGESTPIISPFTGEHTGVLAEACYWTKDGQSKPDPTWVLMNNLASKPGPTFCPDCGRLVVGHNPAPAPGMKPPPTEAEYKTSLASRAPEDPRRDDR